MIARLIPSYAPLGRGITVPSISLISVLVTVKMTLGELEKQLDERFYRVGRSCVVNLTQVSRVTKTEIKLMDKTAIPLPRGAYDGINRAIINMR